MLKRMWHYIRQYRRLLWTAVLAALIGGGFGLLTPMAVGRGIDYIVDRGNVDFTALIRILFLLAAFYLISGLLQWVVPLCANRMSYGTVAALRKDAFCKLNALPLRYFDTQKHGDIMSRITNDIDNIADGLTQSMTQLFTGVVTIAGTLVIMFILNPYVALVVLFVTPLSILAARFIARRSAAMFQAQQNRVGELNGYAEEMISSQRIVKAYGLEKDAAEAFGRINGELYKVGQKAQFYSSLVNPSTRLINHICYISVGVLSACFAARGGGMTIGGIASFLTYATQFAKPINEIAGVATQLQNAIASAARVFDLLDAREESPEPADMPKLHAEAGAVAFDSVRFSYVPEKPLITGLSLTVRPDQVVAVVGPTGAGKTTLVNLLMRFYDVNSGSISIDGTNIAAVTRDSLRTSFSMVLQDTWLFTGTIRENIAYGRPDAAMEEIVEAAKASHAHSFIKRLPEGYDTVIQGSGGDLSQGQQQLLTIARAMLMDPPMLIFDEATSSVDIRTEQYIQRAFRKMMTGRTSFVIAHRLSTIRHADLILVMKDGDIVETGTHETLLAQGGLYTALYNSR